MLRIALCDDHPVVREGLRGILTRHSDIRVVVEVGRAAELLAAVEKERVDVIILDIGLPDMNGLEVMKSLRASGQRAGVLLLSMHAEAHFAVRALKAGAAGYIQKESAPEELEAAVRRVAQGKKYVTASLAERLAVSLDDGGDKAPHEILSDREYQVLCLLAEGKGIKEIAGLLSLSSPTIATYRARVLEKLNLSSTVELVRYAIDNGLVP